MKPAAKQSRLGPWAADIAKLRANGCSLDQVRDFLAANGVEVSVPAISKFIKRKEGTIKVTTRWPAPSTPSPEPTEITPSAEPTLETPQEHPDARTKKQSREQFSEQFVKLAEQRRIQSLTGEKESK